MRAPAGGARAGTVYAVRHAADREGAPLLDRLDLDRLTPAELWNRLDADTRMLAAQSMYDPWDDRSLRKDADAAIASTLRFREVAVKKMPVDKRADYLARVVRPNDDLATSLLTALHLSRRKEMLAAFLDDLGIPQQGGLIDPEHELEPPDAAALARAVEALYRSHPPVEVDVYLATLVAMDRPSWGGLVGVLRENRLRPQTS
jgi:hypothetical protein